MRPADVYVVPQALNVFSELFFFLHSYLSVREALFMSCPILVKRFTSHKH